MSNRTTLLNTNDAAYSQAHFDQGAYAAKNSIAALWPALFQVGDIRILSFKNGDDNLEIPYLITTLAQARVNLLERRGHLAGTLSPTGVTGLHSLESILQNFTRTNVLLDTADLWMMGIEDFQGFLVELTTTTNPGGDLDLLLDQAHIWDGHEQIENYIGFEWNRFPVHKSRLSALKASVIGMFRRNT